MLLLALPLVPPVLPLDEVSELLEPELGCAALELELGEALEPELESLLLGEALAPPEAEPDFEVSELDELDELLLGSLELPLLMPTDELDEPGADDALPEGGVALLDDEEPGVVDDAPPEADPEVEPGALDGDDGVALLELDEPEDLLALSRSHAARPKASATASARVESFMGPPWVG